MGKDHFYLNGHNSEPHTLPEVTVKMSFHLQIIFYHMIELIKFIKIKSQEDDYSTVENITSI